MGIRELLEFASEHHGVFDRVEAERFGVTQAQLRRRVESGDFIRLDRGVLGIGGAPTSWMRAARAATLTTGGFLSHASALALHGVDGFQPGPIEVTIPKVRAVQREGFIVHRSTQSGRAGVRDIEGVPCSSVERALLDHAGQTSFRHLERAVDAVLRQELCDLHDLFDVWVRHSIQGRNGCGPLRRLLDERFEFDPIPDSRWNRMVGQLLVEANLPQPIYEFEIHNQAGTLVGRVDLAFPKHRVAIELDSVRWHLNRESFEQDPRRKNALTLAGWVVLTFTWSDYVDSPANLIRTVTAAIRPPTS